MGKMYIQDEAIEQMLEKLNNNQEELVLFQKEYYRMLKSLERKVEILEERFQDVESLVVNLSKYIDKITPTILEQSILVVGNQYVEELSFVGRDKEIVEYESRKFYQYSVKLKGIEGIYRMMIQTKYEVKEGFKIAFLLAENNNLRKVKIYE